MGLVLSSKKSKEELEMALNKAKEIASSSPVVVFSKTYCGYCKRVKDLLKQLGAAYKVIELDEERLLSIIISAAFYCAICIVNVEYKKRQRKNEKSNAHYIRNWGLFSSARRAGDGGDIHSALAEWTGLRTVPNVFIGGKHIGGCDTVLEKHRAGQLVPLLNDAGAIANNSA